jgi:dienelactone hydrolase
MFNQSIPLRIAILLILVIVSVVSSQNPTGDEWLTKPVDDKTFQTYLDFFSFDASLPFEETVIGVDETEGIHREQLTFQSTADIKVTAYLYYPVEHDIKDRPALILLHGGTGTGKDAPYNVVYSQQLARAGWTVFAIDLLHFGERNSGLLTKFTEKEKHEILYNKSSEYLAWIIQNVKDIGRAFDFLVTEKKISKDRIGLFGMSRGAQVSMIATGVLQKFNAVVLYHGGHFDALESGHSGAACPANYIGRISPIPLLMVNGMYDNDYNKDTSVEPLVNLAKEPKKTIWTEGGHMFATEEDRADIIKWLNKHLK